MGNFYLYKIAEFLTNLLPMSVSYALATFLSDCQYSLSKADRQAVEANLKAILKTDSVAPSQVREVFRNFGRYLADFFVMPKKITKDFIKNHVQITGIEHVHQVLKEGKGVIVVGAHLGNWEMGGAVMGYLGYPLSVVALAHQDPRVNLFFNRRREHYGETVIQTNVALRRCVEHVKRNRLVAILGDRDFGAHGIPLQFLGKTTLIPKGAAIFSLKTGAPLMPAFFLRGPNDSFHCIFKEPIYPPSIKDFSDEDIKNLIMTYLPQLEEEIRKNPTQWLMFRQFEII